MRIADCKAAWCHLAAARLTPTHDVVAIEGQLRPFASLFGGAWFESRKPRVGAWHVPSAQGRQVPVSEPRAAGLADKDLYLDAHGNLWLGLGSFEQRYTREDRDSSAMLAVPSGHRLDTENDRRGGIKKRIFARAALVAPIGGTDAQYARAIAVVLHQLRASY